MGQRYEIAGAAGRLTVRATGPEATAERDGQAGTGPAIVFVHGWASSGEVWAAQLADERLAARYRLLAPDLRGHGDSEDIPGGYDDARGWADDLAAVAGGHHAVLLVGWSYGGLVITDYLRTHGSQGVAGVVLAGALTEMGRGRPGGHIGSAMRTAIPDVLAEDPATAVPALATLTSAMTALPLPGARLQHMLGTSLRTPPAVRAALFDRTVGSGDLLENLDVPALVVHGTEDVVVDARSAEYALGKISGARSRWCEGVGHMPFAECVEDFNRELLEFAEQHLG